MKRDASRKLVKKSLKDTRNITPILESIPYAFFSVDRTWKFTYVNKKAQKLLKPLTKNTGNLVGKNVWKEFPILRKSAAFSELHRSASQQVPVEFEEFFQTADKWLEIQARPSPEGLSVYLRDISVHKQTTRDLRLLAYALTCTKECFYLFDLAGKILFVNKSFLDCFGYREKNILGKDFLCFLSDENPPGTMKQLRSQTARGGWNGEILALRNDGTQFLVELQTSVVKNDGGSPVALVGVARDISDRKRTEDAIRKSEEQFRLIWENSADGMCLTNQQGTVVMANDALARMVGKKKSQIVGKSLAALHSQALHSRILHYHRELFRSRVAGPSIEQELTLWNGKKAWYELSNSFFEMQGQVPLLLTVFRDITDRKRAEEALRHNETKFRTLAENTSAAVFVVLGSRIVYYNSAAEAVTEYSHERLISTNFWDIIHPDFHDTVRAWMNEYRQGEKPATQRTVKIIRRSGEHRWLEGTACAIEFEGQLAFILTCYDITDRKHAEEALLESEERYRRFSELSPVGIAVHSEGKIVFANKAGANLLGASSPQQLIGKNLLDFVHPDYHPVVIDRVQFMMGEKRDVPLVEEKFIRLDGSVVDVEVLATPLTYKNKPAVQVWVHEITRRKRTELERHVMYEIIQGVSTTANLDELLHLIHELLGKVVYAENCFIALYNKSTELFELAFFADLVDTPFSPANLAKSCTAYVFRTGRPLMMAQKDFERLAEQGEVELVGTNSPSWIGIPLKTMMETIGVLVLQHYEKENAYSERDVEFLTSVGSQIALAIERKRTQDTLDASEKRFRSLVQKAGDMISIIDQNGIVQYESPSVTNILGVSPEEIVGKSSFDFDHPDDLPRIIDGLAQLVANPKDPRHFESRHRHNMANRFLVVPETRFYQTRNG